MTNMDCQRAEELFSDHLEGSLHEILTAEVEAHLTGCPSCRELRAALAEVVAVLRDHPALAPPQGLAERVARALVVRMRTPVVRPAFVVPSWVQAAAAGLALITLGTMLMVVGPERPTRAAQRLVSEAVTAGNQLVEKKDRLVEDVRIFGVFLSTTFEGRLDRINERVEDYRKLLERRRAAPTDDEPKSGSRHEPSLPGIAAASRTRRGALA
jgi:hypothetical protein